MKKLILPLLGILALFVICTPRMNAQGAFSLGTLNGNTIAGTSYYGPSFSLTALKSTKLHRFWMCLSTGTATIAIWAHPTTVTYANDGLWVKLGETSVTSTTTTTWTEIPIDLNFMMNVGESWGFIVFMNGGATPRYASSAAPYVYADSYLSMNTQFTLVTATTPQTAPPTAFSFTWGNRKFCGQVTYDEGCYFPAGQHSLKVTDAGGLPLTYSNIPGQVFAKLNVSYPTGAASITSTLNFFRIGGSTTIPEYVYSFVSQKQAGQNLDLMQQVPIPGTLQPGFYRIVPVLTAPNSCGQPKDLTLPEIAMMLIYPGTTFCVVWPGDVDNNGMVNYGDRKALNQYIQDANMQSSWLTGPGRYRADAATNPMTSLNWEGQAGIPWQTSEGCYMDADGSGTINGLDYLAIKINWMRNHGAPKPGDGFAVNTFDMSQNFPNPFNPSTTISYTVPERSQVRLVVTDLLGREVSTLVDEARSAGTHSVFFGSPDLPSGTYIATVAMTGLESGLTFSKVVRMTLSK